MLLKKFHILDHPRKFALYEQELSNKGKIGLYIFISSTGLPYITLCSPTLCNQFPSNFSQELVLMPNGK